MEIRIKGEEGRWLRFCPVQNQFYLANLHGHQPSITVSTTFAVSAEWPPRATATWGGGGEGGNLSTPNIPSMISHSVTVEQNIRIIMRNFKHLRSVPNNIAKKGGLGAGFGDEDQKAFSALMSLEPDRKRKKKGLLC